MFTQKSLATSIKDRMMDPQFLNMTPSATLMDNFGNYYKTPLSPNHSTDKRNAVFLNSSSQMMSSQISTIKISRSPLKRAESPPPLKSFHQTMVLIPYNSNPYQQYISNELQSAAFRNPKVLEIEKVRNYNHQILLFAPFI